MIARRTDARARADQKRVLEQVDQIAEMIAGGEWRGRRSHRELAQEWGCSVALVERRSAEAFRTLARAYEDQEALRVRILAKLEAIGDEQRRADGKVAVAALKAIGDIGGLVTRRLEAKVEIQQQIAGLPAPALVQRIDEVVGRLLEERARLLEQMGEIEAPALPPAESDAT